ncbi:MAG: hypothetical protein ACRCZZ_10970 [Phocaeicola sp.]
MTTTERFIKKEVEAMIKSIEPKAPKAIKEELVKNVQEDSTFLDGFRDLLWDYLQSELEELTVNVASFKIDHNSNENHLFNDDNSGWATTAYFLLNDTDPNDDSDSLDEEVWDSCAEILESLLLAQSDSTVQFCNDCYFSVTVFRNTQKVAEEELKILCKSLLTALKQAKIPNTKVSINNITRY